MRLRTNIASPLLMDCLRKIMANKAFDNLYLVGGTALALQRGHRISIDIDMFTNALYGEMKTDEIKKALKKGAGEYIMKPFDHDILQSKLSIMGVIK